MVKVARRSIEISKPNKTKSIYYNLNQYESVNRPNTRSYTAEFKYQVIKQDILEYTSKEKGLYKGVVNFEDNQIKQYFKDKSRKYREVSINDSILSGIPSISNTRIPIDLVLANFRDKVDFEDIMAEYNLSETDITNSLNFVIELLQHPYYGEEDFS